MTSITTRRVPSPPPPPPPRFAPPQAQVIQAEPLAPIISAPIVQIPVDPHDLENISEAFRGIICETESHMVGHAYRASSRDLRTIEERSSENVMELAMGMNLTYRSIARARARSDELRAELNAANTALTAAQEGEQAAKATLVAAQKSEHDAKATLASSQESEQAAKNALFAPLGSNCTTSGRGKMDPDLDNILNQHVASRGNKCHWALITFFQYNYVLNHEVTTSKVHAQDARDAQLRAEDDLKKARQEQETAQHGMEATQREPEMIRREVEAKETEIKRIQELNSKLEEDKKMNFEFIESEKAHLLDEFKTKKDHAFDMVMYRIWTTNPDLDTSFLSIKETEYVNRFQARLEEEEVRLEAQEAAEATEQNRDSD
ncbi:uncharacterized protein LOC133800082 [Humulus lupulus]|uniref:uncharacterized protein LOC133800082 n=1 Tax=Humulus lupulus TaxID=3486 RepID=UPI002B40AC53|nr:uncharacterized protein LOC133800082 [Humulus lupulus]